jgi:hypothetical protein
LGDEKASQALEKFIPHEDPFEFLKFYEIWRLYTPYSQDSKPPLLEALWLKKIEPYFKGKLKGTPYFVEILDSALAANPNNKGLWKLITDTLFDKVDRENMLGDRNQDNIRNALKKLLKNKPQLKDMVFEHLKSYLPLINEDFSKAAPLFDLLGGQKDFDSFVSDLYFEHLEDGKFKMEFRRRMNLAHAPLPKKIWQEEVKEFLSDPWKDWGHDNHKSPQTILIQAFMANPFEVLTTQDKEMQKAYKIIFSDKKNEIRFFDSGTGAFWNRLLKTRKKAEKEALMAAKTKGYLKGFMNLVKMASEKSFSSFEKNTISCTKLFKLLMDK